MSIDDQLDGLIHRADLDGLVRLIDNLSSSREWASLRDVRDRSRSAVKTGRQIWPAATLAEYRLALAAPPEWAAGVLTDDAGAFAIGPLTEVAAQHHSWADLAGLVSGPRASVVAHERVLRGEAIDPATVERLPNAVDLPYEIADWEPSYALATYTDDGVDAPTPPLPARSSDDNGRPTAMPQRRYDGDVDLAVRQLVEAWTADSTGRAETSAVAGSAADAVWALGVGTVNLRPLTLADALSWLGWAGASGGAHGRRRGAALGRFGALWTLGVVLDVADDWPIPLDEFGEMADDLDWFWWDAGEPVTGWRMQLAVADRTVGQAWAISARDDA